MAMFLAKSSGRNRVARFKPGIELVVKDHAELAGDLRTALSRNEFRVVYQPVMTTGGRVHGVEALLRWEHPVRGMVSPVDFIPIAEETGDIADIGLWVLEQACDQVRHWQRTVPGLQDLELAVNLSPVQLRDPDLIMRVSRILHSTQLRPSRLTLEVTEGSLLADLGLANRQLAPPAHSVSRSPSTISAPVTRRCRTCRGCPPTRSRSTGPSSSSSPSPTAVPPW